MFAKRCYRRAAVSVRCSLQFTTASHSGSHVYVDIWRRIGSGSFQSLSRLLTNSQADGLMSEHPPSSTGGWYEQAKHPFVMDEPNVPAGTRLEYKVYVGLWSGQDVTFGAHRNGEILPPLQICLCVLCNALSIGCAPSDCQLTHSLAHSLIRSRWPLLRECQF